MTKRSQVLFQTLFVCQCAKKISDTWSHKVFIRILNIVIWFMTCEIDDGRFKIATENIPVVGNAILEDITHSLLCNIVAPEELNIT